MTDRIEIRLLGRFFVRRADGRVIEPDDWSTGKTADLLRLLAFSADRPVIVDGILTKLWPDVDDLKAHASLRTAISRIRHVLGAGSIERHLGGLLLRGAWVDVVAIQTLFHEARMAVHARNHAQVVRLAREAESLYIGDFQANDNKSTWAGELRDSLRISRLSLLADAAESSIAQSWMRDAIDFATLAISADPCDERAYRVLMRAYAALGETELALRAFEHCRRHLLEELGADPSPQTRAVHLQVLSGDVDPTDTQLFSGRQPEVESLARIISTAAESPGCDVICVSGEPGSGRESLIRVATARVPQTHIRTFIDEAPVTSAAWEALIEAAKPGDVLLWNHGTVLEEAHHLARALRSMASRDLTIAVIATPENGEKLAGTLRESSVRLHLHQTGPLSDQELAVLAHQVLANPATPALMTELRHQSRGLAGEAVKLLREWITSGSVIATSDGVDLYDFADAVAGTPPVGDYFRTLFEQVSMDELETCQLLAALDTTVWAQDLARIDGTETDRAAVEVYRDHLEHLADLGILRLNQRGYAFRNRALRDTFDTWQRPSAKAAILRRIGIDSPTS